MDQSNSQRWADSDTNDFINPREPHLFSFINKTREECDTNSIRSDLWHDIDIVSIYQAVIWAWIWAEWEEETFLRSRRVWWEAGPRRECLCPESRSDPERGRRPTPAGSQENRINKFTFESLVLENKKSEENKWSWKKAGKKIISENRINVKINDLWCLEIIYF